MANSAMVRCLFFIFFTNVRIKFEERIIVGSQLSRSAIPSLQQHTVPHSVQLHATRHDFP